MNGKYINLINICNESLTYLSHSLNYASHSPYLISIIIHSLSDFMTFYKSKLVKESLAYKLGKRQAVVEHLLFT